MKPLGIPLAVGGVVGVLGAGAALIAVSFAMQTRHWSRIESRAQRDPEGLRRWVTLANTTTIHGAFSLASS